MSVDVLEALSCTLPPLGADARRVETGALFERARRIEWIDDGARLSFDVLDGVADAVLDFVMIERGCCSRLTYRIESAPPHDGIALVIAGPAALRDAIRGWVGAER